MDKKDLLEVRKLFSKSKSRVSTIAGVYISPDHTVLSSFTRTAAAMDEDTADMLTALAAKGMSGKLFRNQMPVEFPMEEEKEGGRQERLNRLLKSGLSDKQEILDYFKQEKINLKNESEIYADYFYNENQEYTVECVIKERRDTLIDLKLNVTSKALARSICDNWRAKSTDVYQFLINELWVNSDNENTTN